MSYSSPFHSAIALVAALGGLGVIYLRRQRMRQINLQGGDALSRKEFAELRELLLKSYEDDALSKETRPLIWVYVPPFALDQPWQL